ncbi:hypothetical protein QOZ80_2BG0159580 [Eleusine coracana subsp. coracana]|nr:hypothetical protein QOZ80_2BG0159580 [Eleusine coracana subsp. coracana]
MVLLLLAFICLFALVASTHSALISNAEIATSNASDHLALLSFKSHIRTDPSQALESWGNRSIPMCQWRGVTCGRRGRPHGRVMALDLENLSLLGAISSSVANLTFLTTLHLPSNHLHGAVSSVLGRLLYLKHVDLSGNFLNSKIPPSLSQCKRLESISLEFNSLQGEIPRELGSLHNAKLLNLGHNKLTGAIPLEISNLVSLEFLHIGRNKLTGEIPAGIGTDFKALIFEFLPNGNLEQWLHQPIFRDGEYNAFDLVRSLDISIDVASALEYLHQNKPLPIIHCDLKPSNILLDHDMVAHVGDVGLARFYHEDPNVTSEKSSAWVKMRGTTGYVAPGPFCSSLSVSK